MRSYVVDDSGSVVKLIIPAGEPDAGTYLPLYNGHGDTLSLSRLETDGSLTLANSYRYETWGKPTTTTHGTFGDLGFRFTYVGEFDVQWDDQLGLGVLYMHARHYAPALGRFLQPDPELSDPNLYAYAANNPVTELDPDGTCFIVCQLVVGAIIDSVVYLATTDNADLGGLANAVVGGAVESAVNPLAKLSKVSKLAKAASKVLSKVPKATRKVQRILSGSRASQRGQIRVPGGRGGSKFREAGPNPFRGKSADEIDDMLRKRGFKVRGESPKTGHGSYTHPRTGRGYHIDLTRHKRPHVDVHRPRTYKGPLEKHRYPLSSAAR